MINAIPIRPALWLLIFISAGFAVYGAGLAIPHYGDDFQIILDAPSSKVFYFFSHAHPSNWYRPLEASFHAASQALFGTSTVPIHITAILSHALLSWLVFSFMMRLGFRKTQAVLGAFFMLFSQANVHPVLSNDTLAQVWSALFGFLSIWFLSRLRGAVAPLRWAKARASGRFYFLSVLAFALALFSKEVGLAFLPILFGFIVFYRFHGAFSVRSAFSAARLLAPYVTMVVVYLVIRSFLTDMQPSLGPGRYQFHLGFNIAENVARLLFAAFVPVSSVTAFVALQSSEWLVFAAIAGAAVVVFALATWDAFRREKRGMMYLLSASALLAFSPVAALNHVSELHVYNALPFIAMLVGAGLGTLWEKSGTSQPRRAFIAILIGLLFVSHLYAIQTKVSLMKQNGERATRLVEQLKLRAPDVPAGRELVLVNPAKPEIEYSVFLMRGFNVLETPEDIRRLINRSDITIKIIEAPNLPAILPKENSVILAADEEGQVYKI